MKYAKMLGLLAVAAAALMVFAGSASATILTETVSHVEVQKGTSIHAVNVGEVTLHGALKTVTCSVSTIEGPVSNSGPSVTVEGPISVMSFTECSSDTVTVISRGSLIVHTHPSEPSTFGTLTSSGATVTILSHLPFNVTAHCSFTTNNTTIGTITSSDHRIATGEPETARIHADATVNVEATDFGCGSTATWTATYDIDSPMHLDVD